jgi:hypothetical protein
MKNLTSNIMKKVTAGANLSGELAEELAENDSDLKSFHIEKVI